MRVAVPLLIAVVASASTSRPHIVLLALDDIGWADVGYHGGDFPTPVIDNLAKTGVELDRMYVMPQCSPTRSMFMTGRFAWKTGMQHFETLLPGSTAGLPKDVPTIAETFKAAGYATHMVGKWHLGYSKWSQTPTGRGFDSSYGYLNGQTDYYNRTVASCRQGKGWMCQYKINEHAQSPFGENAAGYDFWDNRTAVYQDFGRYTIDSYEQRLARIINPYGSESPPAEPLFLYFAEQQLHIPLQSPPGTKHQEACRSVVGGSTSINRTILCAMASRLDQTVGYLVDLLKTSNMWDRTLIFACSDNGGMTHWADNFPASASSNWPLRGGKTTLFEGGVRAVSFVNGGALPPAARGRKVRDITHAVDILPTLARFAGVPVLNNELCDGLDVWDTISSNALVQRTEVPINIGVNPLGGLPPGLFPGIIGGGGTNYSAIISWPWKLIVGSPYIKLRLPDLVRRDGYWTVQPYEYRPPTSDDDDVLLRLYNLESDETEQHNLAAESDFAHIAQRLLKRVQYYAKKENGWVKPQLNLMMPLANPRLHNWTWAPFRFFDEEDEHANEYFVV